jgi:hypothetical protein
MISHGGVVELGTVGPVGDRAAEWGATLAPLEGVRFEWYGGRWVDSRLLPHER